MIDKPRRSRPPSRPDAEAKPEAKPRDTVLIHGTTEDGKGLSVLRLRGDELESGAVRPLEEGKPIQGEVVSLRPRAERPWLCDVDVHVPAPESAPATTSRKGPAQVSSTRYRKNWDAIFARKKAELPN